jgi:hypothetical protein
LHILACHKIKLCMEDKIQVQGKEEVSSPAICKNCQTETTGHYCHFCGQRYHAHKESFGELVFEFASDFVHFDSRFFKTVLPLIFKPGKITRSYNEGKQRSQFHPIRLYMFSSFVYFLLFFSFNKIETESQGEPGVSDSLVRAEAMAKLKSDSLPVISKTIIDTLNKQKAYKGYNLNFHLSTTPDMEELLKKKVTPGQYLASQKLLPAERRDDFLTRMLTSRILKIGVQGGDIKKEYNKQLFESFLHNIPKTLFFLLPVFALLLKLLYIRHKQYYYVDHAILSLHYFSFIFLLLVISHYVLGKIFNTDIFTSLSVLWILAWLFIAMKKIYAQSWKKTFLKFALLGFVFSFTILLSLFMNLIWSAFML